MPTLYKAELMSLAKDAVEQCLNYPKTAKHPWIDWMYMRYFDLYTVSHTVEAQNAFGVPSEYGFTVNFLISDDTAKPFYLMLNGHVLLDKTEEYQPPERKEKAVEIKQSDNNNIRIYDGQLGEYGKKVQLDSYEHDWCMVPARKYESVSNVKTCTVYVDKNKITRNSDGYVEIENVATYTWEYGETIIIEVGEYEHLFNVYGADYTLTPIK